MRKDSIRDVPLREVIEGVNLGKSRRRQVGALDDVEAGTASRVALSTADGAVLAAVPACVTGHERVPDINYAGELFGHAAVESHIVLDSDVGVTPEMVLAWSLDGETGHGRSARQDVARQISSCP